MSVRIALAWPDSSLTGVFCILHALDLTGNEVEALKKSGKTAEQLKALNQDLKKKHKDVKAGYYDLEGKFDEVKLSFRFIHLCHCWVWMHTH